MGELRAQIVRSGDGVAGPGAMRILLTRFRDGDDLGESELSPPRPFCADGEAILGRLPGDWADRSVQANDICRH
jgi:hypothetical protein